MSVQPIFSEDVREDLIDCMEKAISITEPWLREAILATPGLSESDVMAMDREDLVGEAVDLIEEHFNGKAFSIDRGGMFAINLDKLMKEREVMEYLEDIKYHNGLIIYALVSGENLSPTEVIEHFRNPKEQEENSKEDPRLISNPFDTPKGASVKITTQGVEISNAKGDHLAHLKEGFENIGDKLPGLRAAVLRSELSQARDRDHSNEMSLG